MAFYKMNGFTPPTYESCRTGIFKYGRTETIRSATTATKKVCIMVDKATGVLPSKQELKHAVTECSKLHGQMTAEASMGRD